MPPLGPPPEHRATDMIGLMSRAGSRSATSGMNPLTAGVMTIGPRDHRLLGLPDETGIDHETEHQTASIVVIDDDPGHRALLVPLGLHTHEIGDTEALARDLAVSTMEKQTCQFQDAPSVMSPKFRC